MIIWHIYGTFQGSLFAHMLVLWGPRGTPKVRKWVTGAYSVNMGQLDHHVVFGTKCVALQDFQRGKKCPLGVKQTPV